MPPKFRPTILTALPEAGALVAIRNDATGESKEKNPASVPIVDAIVALSRKPTPTPPSGELQLTVEAETQETEPHGVFPTLTVGVYVVDPKLSPLIVTEVLPVPAAF